MNKTVFVVTTTVERKEDGERLASLLLERRLVACAQISGPLTSVYRWQGETVTATEYLLTLKTRKSLFTRIEELLCEEHPYQVPEILGEEVAAAGQAYAEWVEGETS